MAEERIFTLVGKFDDQITKKLKGINDSFKTLSKTVKSFSKDLDKFGDEFAKAGKTFNKDATKALKGFKEGIKSSSEEAKVLGKTLRSASESVSDSGIRKLKDGLRAASEDARVLGRNISNASDAGMGMGGHLKDGIVAAQQEAKVLGEILKANALIQLGQGVSQAGAAGFQGGMGAIGKTFNFVKARFQEAAQDQLQDVQARGSLFGALNKDQMFANAKNIKDEEKLKKINEDNYDITRSISRAMEGAIGDVVKTSTVSTTTITTLSRQLSDNLLPTLLKAKGVTDLSKYGGPEGRGELDKLMGGEKGIGKELATLYEQMGSVVTSPHEAPMAAMGFTQFLSQGTINRQLKIFEQNPVLVDALKRFGAEFGSSVEGRIKALKKAMEVAMPEAALAEARTTIMGGVQSIGDTLTNATVGVLSMGADIANQGQKTLAMAKSTGAMDLQIAAFQRRQNEQRMVWLKGQTRTEKELYDRRKLEAEQLDKFTRGLTRMYENADSPIEIIAATFGPLMQRFANFLSTAGNIFIGPVMAIMGKLQLPLAQLMDNLESLESDVMGGKRTFAEALGRAVGEFFKAIATLFDPGGVAEEGGNAIQKAFKDFLRGFESIDGKKYMDTVLKGLQDLLMKVIFNEGNVLKGLTPLGDGLAKIFLLLSAPAFISTLITGLVPIAGMFFGEMIGGVFEGLKPKLASMVDDFFVPKTTAPTSLTSSQRLAGMSPGQAVTAASPAQKIGNALKTSGDELVLLLRRFVSALRNPIQTLSSIFAALKGGSAAGFKGIADFFARMTIIARTGANWSKIFAGIGTGLGNFRTFLTGVGPKFTGFFKGFLGKLSIFGAVITSIVSLFQGKSLAESLAQGAGPLLGAALGAALIPFLGPFGPMIGSAIGGWIGSLKQVTEPLTYAFEAIINVLQTVGAIIVQVWNDVFGALTGLVRLIPGVSKEFDALRFVMFALLSPFKLLEIAFNGLYELYLTIKGKLFGLSADEQARLNERRTVRSTDEFTIQGRESSGLSLARQKADEYAKFQEAKRKGDKEAMNRIAEYMKSIDRLIAQKGSAGAAPAPAPNKTPAPQPATTPSKPIGTPTATVPKVTTAASAPVNLTPLVNAANNTTTNVQQVNQKAAQQITQLSQINAKTGTANTASAAISQRTAQTAANTANIKTTSTAVVKNTTTTNQILNNLKSGVQSISSKVDGVRTAITNLGTKFSGMEGMKKSVDNIYSLMNSGSMRVKAAFGGTMGRMGGSGVDKFNPFAAQYGLQVTSGFRPGDPGWHGVNRARDYAGSPSGMMKFAQAMMGYPGLKELIYSPLGIGIRNGAPAPISSFGSKVVADHYDHVHVAYGMGAGNPAFFSTAAAADQWEAAMAKREPIVSSVRAKASEVGGTYTLNAPITIHQQPNQDPKALASLVAMELSMAIDELRNHNTA